MFSSPAVPDFALCWLCVWSATTLIGKETTLLYQLRASLGDVQDLKVAASSSRLTNTFVQGMALARAHLRTSRWPPLALLKPSFHLLILPCPVIPTSSTRLELPPSTVSIWVSWC